MGTFNELIVAGPPVQRIQFKYGLCWQLEYHIGDTVKWENINRPNIANGGIVIPGLLSILPEETAQKYYAITFLDDRILAASEISAVEFQKLEQFLPSQISNP